MIRFVLTVLMAVFLGALFAPMAQATPPVPNLKPAAGSGAATLTPAPIRRPAGPRYFKDAVPIPVLKPLSAQTAVEKPVIVIDPGHGGRDPGAIGVNGTHEKTITTAAAQELAKRLRQSGRYTVILTRGDDRYVKHENRLAIARRGQADLFISIHADAAANKQARGATVYTLADRAKGRSKRVVSKHNWILDVDLSEQSDPVGDILVDLAQRSTETQSDAFAEILLEELRGQTQLVANSHRRAGYYVLLAPDVPAVLLELGYLSNVEDEKLLNNPKHRTKIIRGVERAIDRYMAARSG